MKNFIALLKEVGLTLTVEQETALTTSVNENYKTIAEVDRIKDKLTTAETDLATAKKEVVTLGDTLKNVDGKEYEETIKTLQGQIKNFEDAEVERITKKSEADEQENISNIIKEAIGEKKFINTFTEKSILADVMAQMKEDANKGKGAKDIFESITKDTDNIYVNAQQQINTPNIKNTGGTDETITTLAGALAEKYA